MEQHLPPRLAWFTPLPPVRSGVARYNVELLPGLSSTYQIDVFIDGDPRRASPAGLAPSIQVYSAHDFVWKHARRPYDLMVYQLGNAPCHDYMWGYLARHPGLVVLHDGQFHHARGRWLMLQKREDDYRNEFAFDHPTADPALAELGIAGLLGALTYLFPMRRVVVDSARLVAVHNRWLAEQIQEHPTARVEVVEMGVPAPTPRADAAAAIRARHGIAPDARLLMAFGDVTPEKRISPVIHALASLAGALPDLHLLLAGQSVDHYDARAEARALGVADRVTIAGFVPDDKVDDYLAAADICLCLRWPTSRETSAAWLRCLAAGKPTVITDLVHVGDVPALDPRAWTVLYAPTAGSPSRALNDVEPVCVSLDILDEDHSLRLAIRRLATDARLRAELGQRARALWQERFSLEGMVTAYQAVIETALATPRPDSRAPVALPLHFTADGTEHTNDLLRHAGLSDSQISQRNLAKHAMNQGTDQQRPRWIAVVLVVAIAAFLRFWNLSTGLPYRVGADEPIIIEHALQIMKTGDFNPHFFDYPGLYIYVQVLVGCARFLSGASQGLWRTLDQFMPDYLYLWARALTAALGTLTVGVVYFAGLRWDRSVALLAALLMAVWPNHVRESHFALTDVPLTLLTTLVLLYSLRARDTGRLTALAAAGALVGFAAATKYTGVTSFVMPLIVAITMKPTAVGRNLTIAGAAAGAAFLIGAPYTILDLPAFLNMFGLLANSYRPRSFLSGAWVYVGHLQVAAGWSGVALVVAGVLWCTIRAVRAADATRWLLVVTFPLVFFYFVSTKGLIFGRYLLPLLPSVCLLIAIVVVDLSRSVLRWSPVPWVRTVTLSALMAATFLPVAAHGIEWPREAGALQTQDVAYRMVRQFIPDGSSVVVQCPGFRLPRADYRVVEANDLTERSPEEYVADGVQFLVGSSDALAPARTGRARTSQAYLSLLSDPGRCHPAVKPTATIDGPEIWICRLQTP